MSTTSKNNQKDASLFFYLSLIFILLSSLALYRYSGYSFTLFSSKKSLLLLLASGLFFGIFHLKTKANLFSCTALFALSVFISWAFLNHADSKVIFSDDHPSFLYRFQLLKDHFPSIPFYNPDWNAGYSAREFFPSGMLNAYFLSAPLLYFGKDIGSWDGLVTYNYILLWLYVFVTPAAVYFSVKLLGFNKSSSIIAAILAFAPSLSFFEWLLKYGTLGFVLSSAFVPLTFTGIYNLVFKKEAASLKDVFFLLIVSFFAVSWSLIGFTFLPLIFLALIKLLFQKDLKRFKLVLLFTVLFAVCNGPWIKIFIEESKVFSFLSGSVMPGTEGEAAEKNAVPKVKAKNTFNKNNKKSLKVLKENFNKVNPILILCFFPGIYFLRRKSWLIISFLSVSFWIVSLSYFGNIYKPQLELSRLTLPLSFLLIIPAALLLNSIIEIFSARFRSVSSSSLPKNKLDIFLCLAYFSLTSLTIGFVFISSLLAASAWSNKSDEKFVLQPSDFKDLSDAIKEHSGQGRAFFLGFVLHELGSTYGISQDGGHVAPLSYLSGKPLYSSDFYHTKWSTVDPIPSSFRKRGAAGIEEFLDLVNTSSVITAKKEWKLYAGNSPQYTKVFSGDHFHMFTRLSFKPQQKYFLEGAGEVKHLKNGIKVYPKTKTTVVKFRYLPKLKIKTTIKASSKFKASIEPVFVFKEEVAKNKVEDVFFIKLTVNEELIESGEGVLISY